MYFSKLIDKKLITIPSTFKSFIKQKTPNAHWPNYYNVRTGFLFFVKISIYGFWAVDYLKQVRDFT